ncbi:MAG: polyphenol oxidase family protein [Ilumatobacter sp.]
MTYPLIDRLIGDRRLRAVATERADGDVHPNRVASADLHARQRAATGRTWTMLDQVHGTTVRHARAAGVGDVVVTTDDNAHIAVWAADCAPLILAADDGTLVAAHGGWRGLAAGVVGTAVQAAHANGGIIVAALLGPVIGPCCYEFGADELAMIPDAVRAETSTGESALDVNATIAAMLRHHDVELDVAGPCTGCDDRWFSHRVRSEPGRHAVVAWWETP